jgi:hypothetical protein
VRKLDTTVAKPGPSHQVSMGTTRYNHVYGRSTACATLHNGQTVSRAVLNEYGYEKADTGQAVGATGVHRPMIAPVRGSSGSAGLAPMAPSLWSKPG